MKKTTAFIIFILFALLLTFSSIKLDVKEKEFASLEKTHHTLVNDYNKLKSDSKKYVANDNIKLRKKVENLQKKLDSEKKKNASLSKKLEDAQKENEESSTTTTSSTNYLKIKYWFDDKNYTLSDEEQKLYKDPYLSKKVSSKRVFVSSTISEEQLENGQTVYSGMTSKGLVYSSSYIDLSQLESTDYSVSSAAISSEENEKYKKIRFYKTEEKRLGEESEQKWYSDYTLSQEVKDSKYLRIVSEVDDFIASNGVQLYCALTKDGDIVYMHESPNLETINEE